MEGEEPKFKTSSQKDEDGTIEARHNAQEHHDVTATCYGCDTEQHREAHGVRELLHYDTHHDGTEREEWKVSRAIDQIKTTPREETAKDP